MAEVHLSAGHSYHMANSKTLTENKNKIMWTNKNAANLENSADFCSFPQ